MPAQAGTSGAIREIVVHPGAVCIVARPTPDEVLLIRQYRHATGQVLLEIPAGGLNDSESPEKAAVRELEEETGYQARKVVILREMVTRLGEDTLQLAPEHAILDALDLARKHDLAVPDFQW